MNKIHLNEDEIAQLVELYNNNVSYEIIADFIGINVSTVGNTVKELIENGTLVKRSQIKKERIDPSNTRTPKKPKKVKEAEDNCEGGVKCNNQVQKKCLYGSMYGKDFKCDYCTITGHCRTVIDGKSGYNSPDHCHCFVQATIKEKKKLGKEIRRKFHKRKTVSNGKHSEFVSNLFKGN